MPFWWLLQTWWVLTRLWKLSRLAGETLIQTWRISSAGGWSGSSLKKASGKSSSKLRKMCGKFLGGSRESGNGERLSRLSRLYETVRLLLKVWNRLKGELFMSRWISSKISWALLLEWVIALLRCNMVRRSSWRWSFLARDPCSPIWVSLTWSESNFH